MLTTAHSPYDDRIYEREAMSLARAGYDVEILAARGGDGGVKRGIRIVECERPQGRLWRFVHTARIIYERAKRRRADLYHFHDPDLLPWMVALSMQGRRVVYDVHEYNGRSILTKRWLPYALRKPIAGCVNRLEKWASRHFAGVITVNPHMADLFATVNGNVESVANYPLEWFIEACANRQGPPSEFIVYVGGMNIDRGYEVVCDAMKKVTTRREQAECVLVGDVDYSDVGEAYHRFAKRGESIAGVTWQGSVAMARIPSILSAARIGWIPWQSTPNNDFGTPVKSFEYMAAGLPIVASRLGFIASIVKEVGCGLLVTPSDANAHADAICHLLEHPREAAQMGERGRAAVSDRFNWAKEEKKLLDFYRRLLNR